MAKDIDSDDRTHVITSNKSITRHTIYKDGKPEKVIILSHGEKTILDEFSEDARNYVQFQKSQLSPIQRDILNLEELMEQFVEPEYNENKDYIGSKGRWFDIVKDSKRIEFMPLLDKVLDSVYSEITQELGKEYGEKTAEDFVNHRKSLVRASVLKAINTCKMLKSSDKNIKVNIQFGEPTYPTHIFYPISDMNIVARIGGIFSYESSMHTICISKDVFIEPTIEERNDNRYLRDLLK